MSSYVQISMVYFTNKLLFNKTFVGPHFLKFLTYQPLDKHENSKETTFY